MPVSNHRRNDIYSLNMNRQETLQITNEDKYNFADKVIPGVTVFYRTKYCFAFTNIRCVVPGRILLSLLFTIKLLRKISTVITGFAGFVLVQFGINCNIVETRL